MLILIGFLFATSGTLFDLTPRYREYDNHPSVMISNNMSLSSLKWPSMCSNDTCEDPTTALQWLFNETFQKNIGNCINSKEKEVDTPNVLWPRQNDSYKIFKTTVNQNGSFCELQYLVPNSNDITCDVFDDHNFFESCVLTQGNHTLTLVVYSSIMVLCRVCLNNFFSLLDGTAMQYADKHKGSYAMCIIFSSMGCLLSSYAAGVLVVDPKDGFSKWSLFVHYRKVLTDK